MKHIAVSFIQFADGCTTASPVHSVIGENKQLNKTKGQRHLDGQIPLTHCVCQRKKQHLKGNNASLYTIVLLCGTLTFRMTSLDPAKSTS